MARSLTDHVRRRFRTNVLIRVMALMGRRFWPYAAATVIFSATVAVCFNIVLAFMMKDVLDAAVQGNRGLLVHALTLAAVTLLGGAPLEMVTYYTASVCIKRTLSDLRMRLFRHLSDLPLSDFEAQHSGDLVSRATNDLAKIGEVYFDQLEMLLLASFLGVVGMGSIFVLDWRMGWVAIILGLATTATNAAFARPMRHTSEQLQERSGTLTERLIDLLHSLPVARMFSLSLLVHGGYARANAAVAEASVAQGDVQATANAMNGVLHWLRNIGFLGLGLYLFSQGQLSLGSTWAIVALQSNADFMFSSLGRFIAEVQSSLAAAARVFELLDRPAEPECYAQGQRLALAASAEPKLILRGVDFSYPHHGDSPPGATLQDVNLSVASGQVAALVGPSGSGKSTLIKLLLGFYPGQAGEMRIDGVPARQIPLEQLREMMAYVPQEAYLFDGTIEENIRMGRPGASHDEIVVAAEAANAHGFICEQPEGYRTHIGERGARLSGGQRQRIAIARALLKNAPFLLLDEATSALDSESEQLVQDALATLMQGRTTLAIAHRLSTIEHADVVYVLDGGCIVEQGTHPELLARNGLYARLYALQFAEGAG